jgi:hypothetical protein
VAEYRAYLIDELGHILRPAKAINAETDEEAIKVARQLVQDHDIELWQEARRVIILRHKK